jgi:MarR family transcriptional regulator, transcriptional regulator for hemolysin
MNEMTVQKEAQASQLLWKLVSASHMVDDQLDAALERHGLSVAKMGVLRHLAEADGPITLGQLAERLACVKSNITQLIDRLEADGLARRTPDLEDRRSVRAVITDKGRRSFEAGLQAQVEAEQRLLQGLSAEDQAALARLLERFSHR